MSSTVSEQAGRWLWASFKPTFFISRHKLRSRHGRWRKLAELLRLSRAARGRLEWIIVSEKNRKDVSLTCGAPRHCQKDLLQMGQAV